MVEAAVAERTRQKERALEDQLAAEKAKTVELKCRLGAVATRAADETIH